MKSATRVLLGSFLCAVTIAGCDPNGLSDLLNQGDPDSGADTNTDSDASETNGLNGVYFNNMDLTDRVLARQDPSIHFNWGEGSPAPEVKKDRFSVRWTGSVKPRFSETYTFTTASDDGVRLWLDGKLIINNWTDHALEENKGAMELEAGKLYAIKLEFYENARDATIELYWSSSSQLKEIIPSSALFNEYDEVVSDEVPTFPTFTYGNPGNEDPSWIGRHRAHQRQGNQIVIEAADGRRVKIVVCDHNLMRLVLAQRGGDFEPDSSYGVIRFDWPAVEYSVLEREDELVISTRDIHLRVWKTPLRFDFFDRYGKLISRDHKAIGNRKIDGKEHILLNRYVEDGEKLYGMGERVWRQLYLNGKTIENWNHDQVKQYKSYYFLYSTKGYGVFIDNSSKMEFEIDNKGFPNQIEANGHAGEMDYYVIYGPDFRRILSKYNELTGRAYLPPKWALGYQQCRWAYETQERVIQIASTFREKDIPCDAIWLDGPHRGWWKNNVNFEPAFDRRYPNPPKMITDLEDMGFQLALLVNHTMDRVASAYQEGYDKGYYVRNPNGSVFLADQWNGASATVDFTNPRAANWYASLFDPLIDMGVAGWWIDMDDGGYPEKQQGGYYDKIFDGGPGRLVHNPQGGLLDAKALYQHFETYSPHRRPFVMTRGGYTGQQRYAWTWSADLPFNDWSDLLAQMRMEQNMGLMGVVYGSDIAGCKGTLGGNGESYVRWLQVSVFNFFTRSHVNGSEDKEPWSYGAKAEAAGAKWIRWKYQMLPYIYTAAHEMNQTGVPLHRPLVFEYPDDKKVHNMADEFLFGDWMLVAPIVQGKADGSSDVSRSVYLPTGRWIDYRDGKTVYEGPTTLDRYMAPLDSVPIFVKAGAIIPMEGWTNYVNERPLDVVTLDVYPYASSSYTRYEDDGVSQKYLKGDYLKTRFKCTESNAGLTFVIEKPEGNFKPPARDYVLKLHNPKRPEAVNLNGNALPERTGVEQLNSAGSGWTFDAEAELLWIRLADSRAEKRIVIQ